MEDGQTIFSIGHSTHDYERFARLLREARITAVGDVRSAPYSRHLPHFNRDVLRGALAADGIAYVYLGAELGGRPDSPALMCEGVADYEKMADTKAFASGLGRVSAGAARHRIALMCSEQDPLECHRCLLVGRALAARGVAVRHILADGDQRTQAEIEETLLALTGRTGADLFASRTERLAMAYRERGRKVAFALSEPVAAE